MKPSTFKMHAPLPRVVFDMSSYLWTSLLGGTDKENGRKVWYEGKEVKINSAQYGVDNALDRMREVIDMFGFVPMQMLLVFEGFSSKGRRALTYGGYKAGTEKAPDQYQEFQKASDMLWEFWRDLGATKLVQDYAEGDDVIAFLAKNTEQNLLIASNDGDLYNLVGTNEYGADISQWRLGKLNENPLPCLQSQMTLFKSLVGDKSDEIIGAYGFGEAAWNKLVARYGVDGLQELETLIKINDRATLLNLANSYNDAELKLVAEKWETVCQCYEVALLHPEWVDVVDHPLVITPGFVTKGPEQPRLWAAPWYQTGTLVTKANYAEVTPFVMQQIQHSHWVSLDIETAPCEESQQWAEALGKDEDYVDVLGAKTTGLSLTFGKNQQHSVYFSIDHANTDNLAFDQVWAVVQAISKEVVIQNVNFELPVLYLASGGKHVNQSEWGFIPNVRDTKLEAAHVDEESPRGLKDRSLTVLGYTQTTYDQVTTLQGLAGALPAGGVLVSEDEETSYQTRKYNMRELSAEHAVSYGLDDTRCTSALHNYYRLVMELEHTYVEAYLNTEIDAAYMHAASFLDGVKFNLARMNELKAKDKLTMDASWAVIRSYLTTVGWAGTVCPVLGLDSSPKDIKAAWEIVTGRELETAVRTPSKLLALMLLEDTPNGPEFCDAFSQMLAGRPSGLNSLVARHFKGEPTLNMGSPLQKQRLIYETMGLPVRVRNKPTAAMKSKGLPGSPKTDALALAYAERDAAPEVLEVLKAVKLYLSCQTKFNLYYNKYPSMLHWRDGKLHPSFNQSQAATLRASCAGPNFQQMPKNPKIEGQKVEFRECIVPHAVDAVVVSLDFKSQELVMITEYSQDPNMVACFVGDSKKDMHSMTGLGIFNNQGHGKLTYEEFMEVLNDTNHPLHKQVKKARSMGKTTNFASEYGAMAEKIAQTLLVSDSEAQVFIDAKEAAFPGVRVWKDSVVEELRSIGYVTTKLGTRRHLGATLRGGDSWEISKAERQAVNAKIQGSCAEQTKQAQGKAWRQGMLFKYDCVFYGPIHDEMVWSCAVKDLVPFLKEVHGCMTANFAGMSIPIESSISFGRDFGRQVEIGSQPTDDAIQAGLAEMEA